MAAKQDWNPLFHYSLEQDAPKKKYVKMSDRTIKVDESPSKIGGHLRSRSTIQGRHGSRVGLAP